MLGSHDAPLRPRRATKLAVACTAALLVVAAPPPADACSPAPCPRSFLSVPGGLRIVPSNTPALALFTRDAPRLTKLGETGVPILLEDVSPSEQLPRVYRPVGGLAANTSYRLDVERSCPDEGASSTLASSSFTTGEEVPLPTSLGTLHGRTTHGPLRIVESVCEQEIEAAQLRVELAPSEGTRPWLSAMSFETLVDGVAWSSTWSERVPREGASGPNADVVRDTVFVTCPTAGPRSAGVLAEGRHSVVLRATLLGTGTVLTTLPLDFELRCAAVEAPPLVDSRLNAAPAGAGGCTQASLPPRAPSSGLALVALGLFAACKRRRR